MTHWGWYWKVKKRHKPRTSCSAFWLNEIDSFDMYNKYYQVEAVRNSSSKCSLEIPAYNLKAYLQDDDSLFVRFYQGHYSIPVEKKPCNFGGHYYFFHCPQCKKRMRKLYCLEGRYLCRKCGNLAYYTQRLRPTERLSYRQGKIEEYVKNRAGKIDFSWGNCGRKPPRMHNKTFERLTDQAKYYDAKSGLAGIKEGKEWYGDKDSWSYEDAENEWGYVVEKYEEKYL